MSTVRIVGYATEKGVCYERHTEIKCECVGDGTIMMTCTNCKMVMRVPKYSVMDMQGEVEPSARYVVGEVASDGVYHKDFRNGSWSSTVTVTSDLKLAKAIVDHLHTAYMKYLNETKPWTKAVH